MGYNSMHERKDRLVDPVALTVTSGQRANTATVSDLSAFRIIRKPSSAGVLCFVARVAEPASDEATTGYELTEEAPDSGWILADATRFIRTYASGGNVDGVLQQAAVAS